MIARYRLPEMEAIWSEENRVRSWVAVEMAVLEAQLEMGILPGEAAEVLRRRETLDYGRLVRRAAEIEAEVHHDVIAFLWALEEQLGPAGRWVHFGLTSSDVVDTAFSLRIQQAGRLILEVMEAYLGALRNRAVEEKHTLVMGRTHGMYAEPTSLGLKFLSFYAEGLRHRRSLAEALEGLRFGKLSGAVGTYAFSHPEVERRALEKLGLRVEPVSTQILPRDRHARLLSAMAVAGGGIERLAVEIRLLQRTEVGEVEEPFTSGQRGSSAMPHKRNPIRSERLTGMARLLRGYAIPAMENQALWHERDISHSSVERVIVPDAFHTLYYMLHLARKVVEGLTVNRERVRENLHRFGNFYYSQGILLRLVRKGVGRQEAYGWVKEAAHRALRQGQAFEEALLEHPRIAAYLTADEVREVFATDFLAHVETIYRRVLGDPAGSPSPPARPSTPPPERGGQGDGSQSSRPA